MVVSISEQANRTSVVGDVVKKQATTRIGEKLKNAEKGTHYADCDKARQNRRIIAYRRI